MRPSRIKTNKKPDEFRLDSNRGSFGIICARLSKSNEGGYETSDDVVCQELSVTHRLRPFGHQRKTVRWADSRFWETYGVISHGGGWRKDVVNLGVLGMGHLMANRRKTAGGGGGRCTD